MPAEQCPEFGQVQQAVASDRRAWVRQPSTQRTFIQTDTAQPDDFWFLVRIRELSQTGISLLGKHNFEAGDDHRG
jgi:hypothetical protein